MEENERRKEEEGGGWKREKSTAVKMPKKSQEEEKDGDGGGGDYEDEDDDDDFEWDEEADAEGGGGGGEEAGEDILHSLVSLQKASGAWEAEDELLACLGVSKQKIEETFKPEEGEAVNKSVIGTVCVLAFLPKKLSSFEGMPLSFIHLLDHYSLNT